MANKHHISLQERIINEINSTYKSIEIYKSLTAKITNRNNILDTVTANRRIQVVEHKLKALKMMLARIDNDKQKVFNNHKLK